MRLEPRNQYVRASTYPKCPICNMKWDEQINDGNTEIICAGCKAVWQPTNTTKGE